MLGYLHASLPARRSSLLLVFCWFTLTFLQAQYSGGVGSGYATQTTSGFFLSGGVCNCGLPLGTGSVIVAGYPDCLPDGNYDNEFPINLEFLAGGGSHDPAAFEDHYWMLEFTEAASMCSVWSFPFAIGDSTYRVRRTGNSLNLTIDFHDLNLDNSCMFIGFEGYKWYYRVYQLCTFPDMDCFAASQKDSFQMQLVLDMFDIRSNSYYSAYAAPAKVQFGYCENDVDIDLLLGETIALGNDSMGLHWNDVFASKQYLNICGTGMSGIPAYQNYEIVLKDSLGNDVDQLYFNNLGLESGDTIQLDTIWYRDRRCLKLTYKTDGDQHFNRWEVYASGEGLACENLLPTSMDQMEAHDFRLAWNAGMGAMQHAFKIKVYQGGDCVGTSMDTSANRPNIDQSQLLETIIEYDDPRLVRILDTMELGNSFIVNDSFQILMSDLGLVPEACTCYQTFVYQVCDEMEVSGPKDWWGAAMGKTIRSEPDCSEITAGLLTQNEWCEVRGGGLQFDIPGVFCTAFEAEVYLETSFMRDTFYFYSSGFHKGQTIVSDREFNYDQRGKLQFSHLDTLMHGQYSVRLILRDTLYPGTVYDCNFEVVVELEDLLKGTMNVAFENFGVGASFALDAAAQISTLGSTPVSMLTDNRVDLGRIELNPGFCRVDLDFLLDVDDNCVLNYEKLLVTVEPVSGTVSGEVFQGAEDTLRTALVHLGPGDFIFDLMLRDGPNQATWNRMQFIGTVVDVTPPVVNTPGNLVYQIPDCSETTSVYFNLSAIDACSGSLSLSLSNIGGDLSFQDMGGGLFFADRVPVGTYVVMVYGIEDASGNVVSAKNFTIRVEPGGTSRPRQIIGPGDQERVFPSCVTALDIPFDLFVLDECDSEAAFDSITASGQWVVEGDLSGNHFVVSGVTPGENIRVQAYSGLAMYDFTIVTIASFEPSAPLIALNGHFNFSLPVCELTGSKVSFGASVRDDCDTPDQFLDNTRFFLAGKEILPVDHTFAGQTIHFLFSERISMFHNNRFFVISTTDSDNHVAQRSIMLTVSQETASDKYICGGQLNVLLGENCRTAILPSMVLKGDASVVCNDQLQVVIEKRNALGVFEGFYTLNEVHHTGLFHYAVLPSGRGYLREQNGQIAGMETDAIICRGILLVEDKTGPILSCPPDRNTITQTLVYNLWEGELSQERSLYPDRFECFGPLGSIDAFFENPNEPHYYDTWTFMPALHGKYTFSVEADFDVRLSLFQQPGPSVNTDVSGGLSSGENREASAPDGWFDKEEPCSNVIALGEPNQSGLAVHRLSLPLQTGTEYSLLVTSAEAVIPGQFTVKVERDGASRGTDQILRYRNPAVDPRGKELSQWLPYPGLLETQELSLFCSDLSELILQPSDDRCYTLYNDYDPETAKISDFLATRLSVTGFPIVSDNCGPVVVCVSDLLKKQSDCGELYLERSFTATDNYGNKAQFDSGAYQCIQRIYFSKPGIEQVLRPNFTVYLECDDAFDLDAVGNPSPDVTGYPFIRSAFAWHDLAPEWCNLGAAYKDAVIITGCDQSINIRREWTIIDWCRPGESVVSRQLIKIGDYSPPKMDPVSLVANNEGLRQWGDTLTFSVSPFDCNAVFMVPRPIVRDNCSDEVQIYYELQEETTVSLFDHFGNHIGTEESWYTIREGNPGNWVRGLPVGKKYRFWFTAEDACGNKSTIDVPFQVLDFIDPVIACDDQMHVSVGGGSFDVDNKLDRGAHASLFKEDLQEGLWDNCGVSDYRIRRMGTEVWGDRVDFFCEDVGAEALVELLLSDFSGNESICVLPIQVEDKTIPTCNPPADFEGFCPDLPVDFLLPASLDAYRDMSGAARAFLHTQLDLLFGAAESTDNCGGIQWEQELTSIDWHCGSGTFIRSFRSVDSHGNASKQLCVQQVTIEGKHDFTFTFPVDTLSTVCATEPEYPTILPVVAACDLLSLYVSDKRFEASGDECFSLFRTFEVVNWCQFEGNDLSVAQPFDVGRDEDGNGVPGDREITVVFRGNTVIDSDSDPSNGILRSTPYAGGYYRYVQVIAVFDSKGPSLGTLLQDEYCVYSDNCELKVRIPLEMVDACTPEEVSFEAFWWPEGQPADKLALEVQDFKVTVKAAMATVTESFPLGNHILEVIGRDACGNSNRVLQHFKILDCTVPAPVCISGVALELMPYKVNEDGRIDGGKTAVWAEDLIKDIQVRDCSEPIRYSLHPVRAPSDPGGMSLLDSIETLVVRGTQKLSALLDPTQESLVLTCDDKGSTIPTIIVVWDAAGNGDFCVSYLEVQDNSLICGPGGEASIAGLIVTESRRPLENVVISLSGAKHREEVTDFAGIFRFSGLYAGRDYTLQPVLDEEAVKGVTTLDLINIGKHILNIRLLDSPYKMIAADVDNNRSITSLDLIHLRRLILGIDRSLTQNTSWRFVDAAYQFPDPANPWVADFPEIIHFNNLEESRSEGDFIAIKIGDVTLDAGSKVNLAGAGQNLAGYSGKGLRENTHIILDQNQPNPFFWDTNIGFELAEPSVVILSIRETSGRLIHERKGTFGAGSHAFTVSGSALSRPGIYFYTLESKGFLATRKMVFTGN